MPIVKVSEYQTAEGKSPFADWMRRLRDRSARQRVTARIVRMQAGNRGDWKPVGAGVFELRIGHGPGYRVYCGQDGETLVLLLCGGDKRTQAQDIKNAHDYWNDYQARR
ncbi:MAG: type II toxin-antitoxin system RelE/ParE family toxin [Pseudomonadota bacterium]|nr:type II toxin-antitoxin system RelE/ParE family toxin [Pseudomonadota bacterium]